MNPWKRKEVIGDATLYLGDCLEILPHLGEVDAVVTDPPYGVSLSGKRGHYRNKPNANRGMGYASYQDTPENFDATVVPAVSAALKKAQTGLVFMASRSLHKLPPPVDIGGIFLPNGCGLGKWGFQSFMFAALYGADPYLSAGKGCRPNGKSGVYGNDANAVDHPCAKPIRAMEWAIERATLSGAVALDPFMGSGTTGVACANLGRKFIGIELEPKYFNIACERIAAAYAQGRLFA